MKFYFNGRLVRTSKTREYNYAAFSGDNLIACSVTREGAENCVILSECRATLRRMEGVLEGKGYKTARGGYRSAKDVIKTLGGREKVEKIAENLKRFFLIVHIEKLEKI